MIQRWDLVVHLAHVLCRYSEAIEIKSFNVLWMLFDLKNGPTPAFGVVKRF